jgi:hypothetical protein
MELYLGFGYVKMFRKRNKTFVTYMDKMGKTIKTSMDHKFNLEV